MQLKHYFEMKEIFSAEIGAESACNYVTVEAESAVWLKCRLLFTTTSGVQKTEVFPIRRGKNTYCGFIAALEKG